METSFFEVVSQFVNLKYALFEKVGIQNETAHRHVLRSKLYTCTAVQENIFL